MALALYDRVRETSTIVGTGTATLLGAVSGYQSFSVVGNANTTYYCIFNTGTTEWEVGIGTYTASGTTLSRTTVLASSNAGSLVSFTAGTKDVFVTYPAGYTAFATNNPGSSGNVLTSNGSGVGPTWQAAPGATITATTSNTTYYVVGTNNTSGSLSVANVSNTNAVSYNASTGALTASSFSGAGTGLTGTASSLSIGGNAATATTATNQSGGTVSATTGTFSGLATFNAIATSVYNFGSSGAVNFKAQAVGNANSQNAGYSFYSSFGNTADYSPRRSADIYSGFNAANWGSEYLSFNVGNNGSSNDAQNLTVERFRINGAGAFCVNGATNYGTSGQVLQSNGNAAPTWTTNISGNAATATTATTATTANATNTANNFQMNSLGVGTAGSGTAGEIRAINNVTAYYSSDKQFKENVQPIQNATEKVAAIGGKTFDWTDAYLEAHGGEDGYFVTKSDFGVIAQDVQAIFPIAVRTREDGTLAVDYSKLVALAFQAIVELKAEVESLKYPKTGA